MGRGSGLQNSEDILYGDVGARGRAKAGTIRAAANGQDILLLESPEYAEALRWLESNWDSLAPSPIALPPDVFRALVTETSPYQMARTSAIKKLKREPVAEWQERLGLSNGQIEAMLPSQTELFQMLFERDEQGGWVYDGIIEGNERGAMAEKQLGVLPPGTKEFRTAWVCPNTESAMLDYFTRQLAHECAQGGREIAEKICGDKLPRKKDLKEVLTEEAWPGLLRRGIDLGHEAREYWLWNHVADKIRSSKKRFNLGSTPSGKNNTNSDSLMAATMAGSFDSGPGHHH